MTGFRGHSLFGDICKLFFVGTLLASAPAIADYYGNDSYGGSYGGYGGGGGYGGSYGGYGYGGGGGQGSMIISLELDAQQSLNSSLRVAARENRLDDLKRIVSQGGELNSQSDGGETALIYASRNCSSKIVRYLIDLKTSEGKRRVNINLRDRRGRSAIMVAAAGSCASVTKLLLGIPSIDLGTKDRNGRTIREYALNGVELEMGGPASETYALIRAAERARMQRQIAARVH